MRSRSLRALLVFLSLSLTASVHGQTEDPIQALKDSLSQDQQSSILQGIIGKGSGTGTGKKTDQKLSTPETVQSKRDQTTDLLDKENKEKTRDERILRQTNEDPELRADDTVLIDVKSLDDICIRFGLGLVGPNSNNGSNPGGGPSPNNTYNTAALTSAINGASGIAGAGGGIPGLNGNNGNNNDTAFRASEITLIFKLAVEKMTRKTAEPRVNASA